MSENLTLAEIKDAHRRIMSGELTLKKMSEELNMNKDTLREAIIEVSSEEEIEAFCARLKHNKSNNTYIEVNENIINYIRLYLTKQVTLQEAAEECHMDNETFRRKVLDEISKDPVLLEMYFKKGNKQRDYGTTNTKVIIINMLKNNLTQTEMSRITGIPVRTISGWVNKLPEDDELRIMGKQAAYDAVHGIKINQLEIERRNKKIEEYVEKNGIDLSEIDIRSNEEIRLEKLEAFLNQVYDLEKQLDENGKKKYTRKQITNMLGRGNSAIRRAEIERDRLKIIVEAKKNNNDGIGEL